ncbi:FBXL7 family protein [Megaselia abdita]
MFSSSKSKGVRDHGYDTLILKERKAACNLKINDLPDDLLLYIFKYIDNSSEILQLGRVCRRWYILSWHPILWNTIKLKGDVETDFALKLIFDNVNTDYIQQICVTNNSQLTSYGAELIALNCPHITHLQIHMGPNITNKQQTYFLNKLLNIHYLTISGFLNLSHFDHRKNLQFLDLSDCQIDDNIIKKIVSNCPLIIYLYLRRSESLTDSGIRIIANYCVSLRELSISDCVNITDFGMYELARIGSLLRYLSIAKCEHISDVGIKAIAKKCYKLRYLNARGCEAISDNAIIMLAKSCSRLRALDIGKCDISDTALKMIAESCPNLKRLSIKSCEMITDKGLQFVAYYCRGLQHINIRDCNISYDGYKAIRKYCKKCTIEHSNPGFS